MKTFAGHIFKLAKMPLKKSPVRVSHAKQMKYYWGYFLKQNNSKSLEKMRNTLQTPLNHLCNNHNYCNSEWCGQKKAFEQGKILEMTMFLNLTLI